VASLGYTKLFVSLFSFQVAYCACLGLPFEFTGIAKTLHVFHIISLSFCGKPSSLHTNTLHASRSYAVLHTEGSVQMSMETITIDPRGDICIVARRGGEAAPVGYLVSSRVLSLASDAFATLLGPNFREGQALAQSASLPIQISLPEDDAVSHRTIRDVIH